MVEEREAYLDPRSQRLQRPAFGVFGKPRAFDEVCIEESRANRGVIGPKIPLLQRVDFTTDGFHRRTTSQRIYVLQNRWIIHNGLGFKTNEFSRRIDYTTDGFYSG